MVFGDSVFASKFRRVLLVVGIAVAACTAPAYDEQTDKLISNLQSDVDAEIVRLISLSHKIVDLTRRTDAASRQALADARAKSAFAASADFYDKVDAQLTSLRLRVDAAPNDATDRIDHSLDELRANLLSGEGSLHDVHQQQDILSERYLINERKILNAQFQALLTYELVLKTGATAGKK